MLTEDFALVFELAEDGLRNCFDPGVFHRGRGYYESGRVLQVAVTESEEGCWLVSAQVRGSLRTPYQVEGNIGSGLAR